MSPEAPAPDFAAAERVRRVFAQAGCPLETWEAAALLRSEGDYVRGETERLDGLLRAGRAPRLGMLLLEAVQRLRQRHARFAFALRGFLARRRPSDDPVRLETMIALAVVLPDRLDAARRWLDGQAPAEEVAALAALADRCRVPDGVDPELFQDLRAARRFLATADRAVSRIEPWEALCLALENREAVSGAAARLSDPGMQAVADDLNALTVRLLERLLEIRFRYTPLVRDLGTYVRRLPIGRYGATTLDLALGFMVASDEGRERARQWLSSPDRFRREAAIRLEGVIGRAQKYESALRAAV